MGQEKVAMARKQNMKPVSGMGIKKRIHQTYHLVDSEEEKSEMFSFPFYFKTLSLETD
jgi:hypothetical protein